MKWNLALIGWLALGLVLAGCNYNRTSDLSDSNPTPSESTKKALATFDEYRRVSTVSEQCNYLLKAHMSDYTYRYDYVLRKWAEAELMKPPGSSIRSVQSELNERADRVREQTLGMIKHDGCQSASIKNIVDRYNRGFPEAAN